MPATLDLEEARIHSAALAAIGVALTRAGFTERAVTTWFGVGLISDARWVPAPPAERSRRGLGAAIALFVAGESIERRALAFLDDSAIDVLVAAGLVERRGELLRANVSIVPLRGVLIAADRLDDSSADAVGSPDLSALNVAACLPPRAKSLLDVGCGAGVLALIAARDGATVVGTDIDGRALAFAAVNALLNAVPATFVEGDLFAGVSVESEVVVFNAPLVRAPLVSEAPLYLRSPRGEALATEFLAGVRTRTDSTGEVLCHVQLTPAVEEAANASGFARRLTLHFADASDGTPHTLLSLRDGDPGYAVRVRTPLGPALPHLSREILDRLHSTAELLTSGGEALRSASLRPAPWLSLVHTAVHDGAAFRVRDLRLGAHRLDDDDLALLHKCDGRSLDEALEQSKAPLERARALVERGLLVV